MHVKFYLKRPQSAGKTNVFALVSFDNRRIKHYTALSIDPRYWNAEAQEATKKLENYGDFNALLRKFRSRIEAVYYKSTIEHTSHPLSPAIFKAALDKEFGTDSNTKNAKVDLNTFWGFYEDFIKRCESGKRLHLTKNKPLAVNTIKNLKNVRLHLQEYERWSKIKLDFQSFDLTFHAGFTGYLAEKKQLQLNTIGKLITNLKVILHEAVEENRTNETSFRHRRFRSYQHDKDKIYLTLAEIQELSKLDLSGNLKLDKVRDMFIVGCQTGLRHSDLGKLNNTNIKDGMIEIKQTKTGDPVYIPVRAASQRIFEKYQGCLPKISNQKFNEYLKQLGQLCPCLSVKVIVENFAEGKMQEAELPKWQLLTTHTMRRSFATNEYLLKELSVHEIMSLTGHSTMKAFQRYIRMSPRETADSIKVKFAKRDQKREE